MPHDELEAEQQKEPTLQAGLPQASWRRPSTWTHCSKQKLQVQEYVTQLEKQLPSKAEMDALLSDINQAGLGRGLQFELFRPGQVSVKDYYAELPIAIRVTGRYHDIGSFAAGRRQPVAHRDAAQPVITPWPGPRPARCRWMPRRAPSATSTPPNRRTAPADKPPRPPGAKK